MKNPEGGKMNLGHYKSGKMCSMKMDDPKEMESEQDRINIYRRKRL